MQPIGNLQLPWIMFDHVKCVKGWTTLVCHVYDLVYCKVVTIAICNIWGGHFHFITKGVLKKKGVTYF